MNSLFAGFQVLAFVGRVPRTWKKATSSLTVLLTEYPPVHVPAVRTYGLVGISIGGVN